MADKNKLLMAMDDERFRQWFQPQHNIGVDPYTLKRSDRKPHLVHVYEDGIVQRLAPYSFFYCKWKKPSRSQGRTTAMDDERFRRWFQPQYNKDIDPWTLRKDDKEKRLIHHHENGVIQRITCRSLFANNAWHISKEHEKCIMAWDDERFREWYQPEYNPGIDVKKLRKYDKETRLVHYHENGVIRRITCKALFTSNNWNSVKSRNSFAMEYREFREWYQPEHNIGVEPWKLRKSDTEKNLKHVYENGAEQNVTARRFFREKSWLPRNRRSGLAINNQKFKEWYQPEHNPDVDISKLYITNNKTKLVHVFEDGGVQIITAYSLIVFNRWDSLAREYKLAMEYPEFASWFQPHHNVGIDPWSITRSDERHLIHVDKDGNERRVTPKSLFATNRWELIGKRGLLTNAIKEDEDIALFVPDEDMKEKMKRCKLAHKYIFTCPFCGEEFNRKIGDMIGRSPKCPSCRDLGLHQELVDDKQSDGCFLTRVKDNQSA